MSELTYGNNLQERRGYYGLGGNWDSRPGSGLAAYGRLWRIRVRTAAGTPLFDLRYNYDNVGNMTRLHEAPRQTANWPTTYTFQDSFNSKDTGAWTWSSYQTVPFNDGGNNVVKSSGTDANFDANFYRNTYSLTDGKGLQVRFKVDRTDTAAHFAIEANDGTYRRFGVIANHGRLYVQYNDGGGYRYPADLLTNLQLNTWYVVRIVVDNTRGFYVEAYQESAPGVWGSYQQWLPAGLAWRFHHWIWRGNAYIDDYREFNAAGITWSPDERMNFSYDALHRLISAAADSGAQGYGQTYQYNAIGNLTYKSDVGSYTYPAAGQARPHAATAAGSNSYSYDANGNMVSRTEAGVTYTQTWDEENRLKTVTINGQTTTYVYDGDGRRVKKVQNGQTTVYIGDYYEKNLSTGVVTKYYYANGQRVAQRQGSTVYYLTADHLGSTSLVTDVSGNEVARQKYYPFGAPRSTSGTSPTDYRFTGQRSEEAALGSLYDYNARFYSPVLGRFIQPDTIVPEPGNPEALNRYAYVLNNPLRYTDPTGHFTDKAIRAYLQATHGDAWEQYWKAWLADEAWMNLLHAAQGDDLLLEIGWESGTLGLRPDDHSRAYLRQFRFQGKGHDTLSGITLEQTEGTPAPGNIGSLQDLYATQPGGLAVLSSQGGDGNMMAIATWGGAQVATSQVTRGNVRFQKALQWGFNALVTKVFPPFWLADFAQAIADPDISSLPGCTEGDRTLMVQLAVDVQGHRLTAGYSSMFRDGTNLYGAWYFGATWSATLPPK